MKTRLGSTVARFACIPALMAIGLLTEAPGSAQSRRGDPEVVFLDVKLSAPAVALLREVERIYGKPVVGEKTPLSGDTWASSRIDDNGTPRVRVAPPGEGDESTLVHELLHLKLRAQGAPVFYWLSDGGEPALDALLAVQAQLYDAIQHRAFAPEMRRLGFEPSGRLRESLRKMIATRNLDGSPTNFGKALVMIRTFIEFGAGVEMKSIRDWYAAEGWTDALALGNRAADALATIHSEPREHVSQFLAVLRLLDVNVTLDRYDTVMLGQHRQVRAVVIHRLKAGR